MFISPFSKINIKGLSIKDVRTQGGLTSVDILRTRGRGSSDAGVRTFWRKKIRIFRNLWCVRTDKEGGWVGPVRTFCGQEGRVNFSRFCADVFFGRPLTRKAFTLNGEILKMMKNSNLCGFQFSCQGSIYIYRDIRFIVVLIVYYLQRYDCFANAEHVWKRHQFYAKRFFGKSATT